MELSRPEYWSGKPFSSPGDLPIPGIEPRSPALPVDSLPTEPKGSPRILEWMLSHFNGVQLSATLWTSAHQAPLSMEFSRQEYWSGLPFPSLVIKYEVSEMKSLSCVQLFVTPWTVAYQAPPSMGFSKQEYWSGLPFRFLPEWVAHPFSRGSSLPRNQTGVSCIAGGFFTSWAIREAQPTLSLLFTYNICSLILIFFLIPYL